MGAADAIHAALWRRACARCGAEKGSFLMEKRRDLRVAWVLYCALMLWLLFGQRWGLSSSGSYREQLRANLNLVPLRTIRDYIHILRSAGSPYLRRHAFCNLAGNVCMFVPLGLLLPPLAPRLRALRRFAAAVTAAICAVELAQLLTLLGSCDIDDLILNLAGALLGYGLWRLLTRRKRKEDPHVL